MELAITHARVGVHPSAILAEAGDAPPCPEGLAAPPTRAARAVEDGEEISKTGIARSSPFWKFSSLHVPDHTGFMCEEQFRA